MQLKRQLQQVSYIITKDPPYASMNTKKKLQHISYGITKNEASYQIHMVQLMSKLLQETRENNHLLRRVLEDPIRRPLPLPVASTEAASSQNMRKNLTGLVFYPSRVKSNLLGSKQSQVNHQIKQMSENSEQKAQENSPDQQPFQEDHEDFKKMLHSFQQGLMEMTQVNKKIYERLEELQRAGVPPPGQGYETAKSYINSQKVHYEQVLLDVLEKKEKTEKKGYGHYGIISEIMPFSDKREMKVRFKIIDLMEKKEINKNLNMADFKSNTTEWVGMVFRATASICWNMLYGGQLSFEEVKVLFTENIIFNFIEYMKDIEQFVNEEKKLELTNHINFVSCEVLEFLCRQYPQTKVEAPNIALRKAIPLIENQGQSKFDLVTMVCRDSKDKDDDTETIEFKVRVDKDYSTIIMKVINFMIDKTETEYPVFEKFMTNIFEKIYLPKEKRSKMKAHEPMVNNHEGGLDSQYREKVKSYSSYLIGRKIPKNTPKYTKNEIQYGVFFVKAPSILRIITKWFEQLWEFVNTPLEKLKNTTTEIKDHNGNVLNISTRVKHLLYQKVNERLAKIQTKIERLKTECYNMELFLTNSSYTNDSQQIHLSQDQLSVGKYCSNLKNAISSYVCSQLSKIMYYLLLIPQEIDQKVLEFNDQDFQEQARKHLDSTNLVSLKIFDLLRCKCHSNQEEIIYIVQALKQFQKDDPKFQIVRVKDRLNQGTRDILINAQYDNGLVWEIQLAVTSHADKKQDLLDKYNHFLYELKRSKLGPLSQCVSIWSSLEQRSIYFEQLILKKKTKSFKCAIEHKGNKCKENQIENFNQFKRPIICYGCKEYYAIPLTSLLNVRCEECRVTFCGTCYYNALDPLEKKKFMFRNFDKKKLLNNIAFQELQEYTDFRQPLPRQGFFIKKKFLNRQLSFYKITKVDQDRENCDEYLISISQIIIKNGAVEIRSVNKKQLSIIDKEGQYYLKGQARELANMWIFYFKKSTSQRMTLSELQQQIKDPDKYKMKYLNVLFEPNYMNQLKLYSKIFEKVRLLNNIKEAEDIDKYNITVYRFPNLTVLAKLQIQDKLLQELLIKKSNRSYLEDYAEKKISIINMEQSDLTDEIESLVTINSEEFSFYFTKVQKLYLADNDIQNISCFKVFTSLESLSISKNRLVNLKGIEELTKIYYIKFDENNIVSLNELRKLVSLTYISGNINSINSLDGLEKLINLGSLSLCQNKISSLAELKGLIRLKRIYLRDNPIETIAQLKSIPVKHLYTGNTKIDPMEIASLGNIEKLKELSLKNLRLTSIPKIFEKTIHLQELKLSKNNIKKIQNIEKAINIIRLDLSENQIQKMDNLSTLENLEVLNLKNNKITVVSGVKPYIQSLKILNLELNPLDDLSDYLIYEEKMALFMRLKFTDAAISAKAREQLKNHTFELGNKSQSDG